MIKRKLVSLEDFHESAREKMTPAAWGYYEAGADSCSTSDRNSWAFGMYKLRQRVLQGNLIERFDLSTEIFGKKVKSPIGIAPTAMQRMAHPLGEVGAMRAAESRGMVYPPKPQNPK